MVGPRAMVGGIHVSGAPFFAFIKGMETRTPERKSGASVRERPLAKQQPPHMLMLNVEMLRGVRACNR